MYNLRKRKVFDYAEHDYSDYEWCPACADSYIEHIVYYPEFSNYEILLEQFFEFISDDNFYLKNLFCETDSSIYEDLVGLVFE